ncbi:MAG: hypothetical protein KBG20_07315 [Caldilineaceae bacterium]|nr:hypothetical protein [Caldilineaceae bacterium]MBP8108688.1 hypothetical protein [Caldilineaceae bacterium]MBP8125333.1 hypothetical protein [Caldilineaceae bacterium]MBP9072089.1 hypothetical protein [Caldilineaceae bacterium]
MSRILAVFLIIAITLTACSRGQSTLADADPSEGETASTLAVAQHRAGPPTGKQAAGEHPRLWITTADLPRLRAWANASNPLYRDGLALLAERAKQEMDEKRVPDEDCGNVGYEEYPTESYAELFAFLSLIENDEAARNDYADRAHTLIMYIMNEAAKGPATAENYNCGGSRQYPPFRHPDFATEDRDRIRYHGEAFPLVVDWIYPSFSAEDKATIRKVFLRWSQEVITRGYHHPEPVGLLNDPALLADPQQVRFSGNNYYAAHMRNLGLMALSLDPADDADGVLRSYLDNATGAYLYIIEQLIRGDSRGGLLPEGLEYSPQTIGYVTQFLLALHTSGVSYPQTATLTNNPFWSESLTAYIHSLSPATVEREEGGTAYQPAFYGDGQSYRLPDFVSAFAPIGLYDIVTNNPARLNSVRWLQTYTAPGGREQLVERVRNPDDFREAILYFMLFDPAAPMATDPRPALSPDFLAPGLNRLFSRTGWGTDANWYTYGLSWNSIDHQMADGNSFAFYRKGEWLTKGRVGYADIAEGIASSEFYNTVAIQNDRPAERDDSDWRTDLWQRGSQWNLVAAGDPTLLAHSTSAAYAYALGDATNLYNSTNENVTDIAHASRSILWLKPDHIIVYDRAETMTAERFKRWWLQLPQPATISGKQATMRTATGQQLFVTTLLPENVTLTAVNNNEEHIENTAAGNDPMQVRLKVEAMGNPQVVRFLHVLQGADAGVGRGPATVIKSADELFEGVVVRGIVVLFPVNVSPVPTQLTYVAPTGITHHFITGLTPDSAYSVQIEPVSGGLRVTVQPGGEQMTDSGGVLQIGDEPIAVDLTYLPIAMR